VNGVLSDPATDGLPLERLERIRRMVRDVADMRGAAADALGPAWETRTPAERDEFAGLFADMLERAYVARFAGAVRGNGRLAPVYTGEVLGDGEAMVATRLRSGGGELSVDYRMVMRDGRWRVRDVVLDGVSTVANYRAQFRRLAGVGGHASLVRHLRAKLADDSILFARSDSRPASSPVATPGAPAVPPPPVAIVSSPPPVTAPPAVSAPIVSSPPAAPSVARATRPPEPAPATRPVAATVGPPKPAVVATAIRAQPRVSAPAAVRVERPTETLTVADALPARGNHTGQWLVTAAFAAIATAVWRRWRAAPR
jgi:phospholipid transport system substrate-binding protein